MPSEYRDDPGTPYIESYRKWAAAQGYNVSNYTNKELTRKLGDAFREQGMSNEEIGRQHGHDFKDAYLDIINAPEPGREGLLGGLKEIPEGFERGFSGLVSSGFGVAGLAADITGMNFLRDPLMDKAAEWRADAAMGNPSISRASDVRWDNVDEVARFLAGGFGEAAPSAAEAIGSFYLGGGIGYQTAKQAVKKRLKKAVSEKLKNRGLTKEGRREAEEELGELFSAVGELAGKQGFQRGSSVGIGLSSFGMNMGEVYSELHPFTQLDPSDPEYVAPDVARSLSVTYGGFAGSLDFASAGTLLNKVLRIGDKPAETYLRRLAQNLPAGLVIEGTTEAAQEFLMIAAEKYAKGRALEWSEDELNRMFDAGVLGAIGGAQFSMFGAIKGPKRDREVAEEEVSIEPQSPLLDRQKDLETLLGGDVNIDVNIGDDVRQAIGVAGKVHALHGDLAELSIEGRENVFVPLDSLIKGKPKTKEELEAVISDEDLAKEAEGGNPVAEAAIADAHEELNKADTKPLPTPPGEPADKTWTASYTKPDGSTASLKTVSGLTEAQKEALDEVFTVLQLMSERYLPHQMNHQGLIRATARDAGLDADVLFMEYQAVKMAGFLEQAGITKGGLWALGTKQEFERDQETKQLELDDRNSLIGQKGITVGDIVTTDFGDGVVADINNGYIRVEGLEGEKSVRDLDPKRVSKQAAEPASVMDRIKAVMTPEEIAEIMGTLQEANKRLGDADLEGISEEKLAEISEEPSVSEIAEIMGTLQDANEKLGEAGLEGIPEEKLAEISKEVVEPAVSEEDITRIGELRKEISRLESSPLPEPTSEDLAWAEDALKGEKDRRKEETRQNLPITFGIEEKAGVYEVTEEEVRKRANDQNQSTRDAKITKLKDDLENLLKRSTETATTPETGTPETGTPDTPETDAEIAFKRLGEAILEWGGIKDLDQQLEALNPGTKVALAAADMREAFITEFTQLGDDLGNADNVEFAEAVGLVIDPGSTQFRRTPDGKPQVSPSDGRVTRSNATWLLEKFQAMEEQKEQEEKQGEQEEKQEEQGEKQGPEDPRDQIYDNLTKGELDLPEDVRIATRPAPIFTESLDKVVRQDGTIITNDTSGLGKQLKSNMGAKDRSAVLLVLKKLDNNGDDIPAGTIRVMSAVTAKAKGETIVKVYDSQHYKTKPRGDRRPPPREGNARAIRYFDKKGDVIKGHIGTLPLGVNATNPDAPVGTYQIVGKLELVKDTAKGAVKSEKAWTGRNVEVDSVFDSIEEVQGTAEFKFHLHAMATQKSMDKFETASVAQKWVEENENKVLEEYANLIKKNGLKQDKYDPGDGTGPTWVTDENQKNALSDANENDAALISALYQIAQRSGLARLVELKERIDVLGSVTFKYDEKEYNLLEAFQSIGREGPYGNYAHDSGFARAARKKADDTPTYLADSDFTDKGTKEGKGEVGEDQTDEEDIGVQERFESETSQHFQEADKEATKGMGNVAGVEERPTLGEEIEVNEEQTEAGEVLKSELDEMLKPEVREKGGVKTRGFETLMSLISNNQSLRSEILALAELERIYSMFEGGGATIYNVLVDMYQDPDTKEDVWVVENIDDAQAQLDEIKKQQEKRREPNRFSEIEEATAGESGLYRLRHPDGDKLIYLREDIDINTLGPDKHNRQKGKPYKKPAGNLKEDELPNLALDLGLSKEANIEEIATALGNRFENLANWLYSDLVQRDLINPYKVRPEGQVEILETLKPGGLSTKAEAARLQKLNIVMNSLRQALGSLDLDAVKTSRVLAALKEKVAERLKEGADTNKLHGSFENDIRGSMAKAFSEEEAVKVIEELEWVEFGENFPVDANGNSYDLDRNTTPEDATNLINDLLDGLWAERAKKALGRDIGRQWRNAADFLREVWSNEDPVIFAQHLKEFTEMSTMHFYVDDEGKAAVDAKPSEQAEHNSENHERSTAGGLSFRMPLRTVSPVDGQIVTSLPLVVDEKSAAAANTIARKSPIRRMAGPENPLEMVSQETLGSNQLAIQQFAEGLDPTAPMSLDYALNRVVAILNGDTTQLSDEDIASLRLWAASLNGNSALNGVKLRFVGWEEYRKYASMDGNSFAAGVFLPASKEILMSELFWDGAEGVAMDALLTAIVHEAIHAPTKQALDIGYAMHTGDTEFQGLLKDAGVTWDNSGKADWAGRRSIEGAGAKAGLTAKELGEVYGALTEVLLPFLRSKHNTRAFHYGLVSPDEFLSELGSSKSFRAFLKGATFDNATRRKLGIPAKSWIRTAWDWVLNLLSRLTGFRREPEVLKYAEQQLNRIIELSDKVTGSMSAIVQHANVRKIDSLAILAGRNSMTAKEEDMVWWLDGTERQYIDDIQMEVRYPESGEFIFGEGKSYTLEEVLNHPALFEAYPEFKSYKIEGKKFKDGTLGMFSEEKKTIYVQAESMLRRSPMADVNARLLNTIFHELQHAVDAIEGFSSGTSTSSMESIRQIFHGLDKEKALADAAKRGATEAEIADIEGSGAQTSGRTLEAVAEVLLQQLQTLRGQEPGGFRGTRDWVAFEERFNKAKISPDGALRDSIEWSLTRMIGALISWNKLGLFTANKSAEMRAYQAQYGEVTSRITGKTVERQERVKAQEALGEHFPPRRTSFMEEVAEAETDRWHPSINWQLPNKQGVAEIMHSMQMIYSVDRPVGINRDQLSVVNGFLRNIIELMDAGVVLRETPPPPDDNAKVQAEAAAAGLNELITTLSSVYNEVQSELRDIHGSDMEAKDFLDAYGKVRKGWGRKSVSTVLKAIQKNLKPFNEDAQSIRIVNAGLNRVARFWGTKYGVEYLEKTSESLRSEISKDAIKVENMNRAAVNNSAVLEAFADRKFKSPEELGEKLKKDIVGRSTKTDGLLKYKTIAPKVAIDADALVKELSAITASQWAAAMQAIMRNPDGTPLGPKDAESASPKDMMTRVETSIDPDLSFLQGDENELMRTAFVIATKQQSVLYSLLRVSLGDKYIQGTQRDFLDAGDAILRAPNEAALDSLKSTLKGSLSPQLNPLFKAKRELLKLESAGPRLLAKQKVEKKLVNALTARSTRLRTALGELEPVEINNGAIMITMRKLKNEKGEYTGAFERRNIKIQFSKDGTLGVIFPDNEEEGGGTEFTDKKGDKNDFLKVNRETLEFLRLNSDMAGEIWYDAMKEQAELAAAEPVIEQWYTARRGAMLAGLESVNQRLGRLGYHGKKLAGMTARTVAIHRDIGPKAAAYAKRFNVAYYNIIEKLGVDGETFEAGTYQDIWWWFDNHPEFAGREEDAFNAFWTHFKDIFPDKTRLSGARRAMKEFISKTIEARDYEAALNRSLGNRVRDDEVQVQSVIDGKMVDFYRLPMEMGFTTLPRQLDHARITSIVNYMRDNGWSGKLNEMNQLELAAKLANEGNHQDIAEQIIPAMFDKEIMENFLNPWMTTDVRMSVFYGPKEDDGWGREIGNSLVGEMWEASNGDVQAFMDSIYEIYGPELQTDEGRAEWYYDFLKQIHKRFRELNRSAVEVERNRNESGLRVSEAMKNTPRSLDARQVESRLPREFFRYDMYDEVSTNIRVALFAATSVFGRDGKKANNAYVSGKKVLDRSLALFNVVMSEAIGPHHDKPRSSYSRKEKRAAYKILRKKGFDDAPKKFNQLYNDSVAYGELKVAFERLGQYYGKTNVSGPYQDANLLLEILGTQSLAVLNNPKSSFWQGMSMAEFPLAFRGLNKMGIKGSGMAVGNFINQMFGGIMEAMGMQLDRVGNYAANLNNTHFRMAEMDLPFKTYNSLVGNGAELTNKYNPKKWLRTIKNIMSYHGNEGQFSGKDKRTRAPINLTSLVAGPFHYFNNIVNHSVGVGANFVYQDLILQTAKYIEENNIQDIREITPNELGMGEGMMEWVVGESDGWNHANNMLVDAGAPSLSRMAFDYVDRKRLNPKAPVIERDKQLLINHLAMNNMSGEGFNSKPSWLYTAPGIRYFAFFLGWPLGKMARDNKFIFRGDNDSVTTYMAFIKYLALMSAVYMPVGLSFAFLVDWYDEEVLGKPNNLPPVTPWAALPVVGLPLAMRDENFTMYSLTSRLAKAGTPYGMGFDVMNSIAAKGDPYGAGRELSLDSRIFAWSMFKNIYDAMGNWMHQGEFDWANVGRPISYGIGGNSVLQLMDATTNLIGIDTEERRVADYIGVRNSVKKTAWLMSLPLRPPYKGGGRPNAVSVNVKQMERAAYANDTSEFLKQYQEAIIAARQHLSDTGREGESPEDYVIEAFKDRNLRTGITRRKISDGDWASLLSMMDPDQRSKVMAYESAHFTYLKMIGGGYGRTRASSADIRRDALHGVLRGGTMRFGFGGL